MIYYVCGELVAVEEESVVIDAMGVGYEVFMAGRLMERLPQLGSEVKIYTYHHVKEDAQQLFGFFSRDEVRVFRLLIGVSGIGPKGGLSILSTLTADELRFAVSIGDVKAISAANGIGKKTAEKLIIELKDKLCMEDTLYHEVEEIDGNERIIGPIQEAVSALTALGYSSQEALKAVKSIKNGSEMQVEELLKLALKNMM